MRLFVVSLAISALLCAGCSSSALRTEVPAKDAGAGVVELRPAGNKTYLWQGQIYSVQELTAALTSRDKARPVERINLLDGDQPTTIADVVDVAVMAKMLGASPFLERDGKLQPVNFEIAE